MISDHEIIALGMIYPLNPKLVQPASVDLTLGKNCAALRPRLASVVVGKDSPEYVYHTMNKHGWTLHPGDFMLFDTAETLHLPDNISGKFEGKSSLGRIGLMTHVTAGFIDPGFRGVLTLEIYNVGPLKLLLRPGIKIGQVAFTRLDSLPTKAYGDPSLGSHYQGSESVQGGKF